MLAYFLGVDVWLYAFIQVCAMNHNENILNANVYHLNVISITSTKNGIRNGFLTQSTINVLRMYNYITIFKDKKGMRYTIPTYRFI